MDIWTAFQAILCTNANISEGSQTPKLHVKYLQGGHLEFYTAAPSCGPADVNLNLSQVPGETSPAPSALYCRSDRPIWQRPRVHKMQTPWKGQRAVWRRGRGSGSLVLSGASSLCCRRPCPALSLLNLGLSQGAPGG